MGGKRKKPLSWSKIGLPYEEAIKIAWQRGLLQYKLYEHQKPLFKIISNKTKRKTCINSSRRFGKTTALLIFCFKFGIQNPDSLIRFVSPTQKSLRKSIFPIIRDILRDCPPELKPKWNTQDGCYKFPNGTELHIYGTDNQQHDSLRGQKCDIGVIDEAAYCSDLHYIVQDILLPQTLTCGGRLILASTPQKKTTQSGEEFKEFCSAAEQNAAYHTQPIYANTSLSKRLIEEYCEESGGKRSITWRVEYLCEFLVDPEKALIPEWNTDIWTIDVGRPENYAYFHKYVCMDLGVKRDFTCMLFGYYNFTLAKLIILDEVVMKNMVSTDLVEAMRAKEEKYFTEGQGVYRRIADSDNPLLLNDLCHLHGLPIMPTTKTALEAMVNELRVWVNSGKIIINPRCKFLIGNLEKGVWADNAMGQRRQDFGRTKTYGHFDGIAALMYLVRNIDASTNPIPPELGINWADAQFVQKTGEKYNGPHKDLKNLFTKKVFK